MRRDPLAFTLKNIAFPVAGMVTALFLVAMLGAGVGEFLKEAESANKRQVKQRAADLQRAYDNGKAAGLAQRCKCGTAEYLGKPCP